MSLVYLNGEYVAADKARISPMDRGFLFGDGIYEVIPCYEGKYQGFSAHIQRLERGLAAVDINHQFTEQSLKVICDRLVEENGAGNLGVYLHVTRGVSEIRSHGYSSDMEPTLFAYTFDIEPVPKIDPDKTYQVDMQLDQRWQHKDIKTTALLGNVMHFQQSQEAGYDETLLFNQFDELTEAAACNVFIVKDGVVATPELDHQKLSGITRLLIIDILTKYSSFEVQERLVTKQEVLDADEVWLTSATKQIGPVVSIQGHAVGAGKPGPVWQQALTLYRQHQFDY